MDIPVNRLRIGQKQKRCIEQARASVQLHRVLKSVGEAAIDSPGLSGSRETKCTRKDDCIEDSGFA